MCQSAEIGLRRYLGEPRLPLAHSKRLKKDALSPSFVRRLFVAELLRRSLGSSNRVGHLTQPVAFLLSFESLVKQSLHVHGIVHRHGLFAEAKLLPRGASLAICPCIDMIGLARSIDIRAWWHPMYCPFQMDFRGVHHRIGDRLGTGQDTPASCFLYADASTLATSAAHKVES